jgi:hypothetical protein
MAMTAALSRNRVNCDECGIVAEIRAAVDPASDLPIWTCRRCWRGSVAFDQLPIVLLDALDDALTCPRCAGYTTVGQAVLLRDPRLKITRVMCRCCEQAEDDRRERLRRGGPAA